MKSKFGQLFGMFSRSKNCFLFSQRLDCGCVHSGCMSNRRCMQFVFKKPCITQTFRAPSYARTHISSDSGMFQTVAPAHSQLRCRTVGAVQVIREAEIGFQKQLLTLRCLHVGSPLHTGAAQSPKSQMAPFAWCPTVDSEQGSWQLYN